MNNRLFDRLRLQAQMRTILAQWGAEPGLELILTALEKELQYEHTKNLADQSVPNDHSLRHSAGC
jgi:hypothetical protein